MPARSSISLTSGARSMSSVPLTSPETGNRHVLPLGLVGVPTEAEPAAEPKSSMSEAPTPVTGSENVTSMFCDDVVIINEGAVALAGAVRQLRADAPHRHVQVEVRDAAPGWIEQLEDVAIVGRQGDRVVLDVSHGVDLGRLLAAAQAAGDVVEFSYEPPSLNEVFLDAVSR